MSGLDTTLVFAFRSVAAPVLWPSIATTDGIIPCATLEKLPRCHSIEGRYGAVLATPPNLCERTCLAAHPDLGPACPCPSLPAHAMLDHAPRPQASWR